MIEKYIYMPLHTFLLLPEAKDCMWSYMGRDNNAGRYREWYVAVCDRTHNGCRGYFVFEQYKKEQGQ